METLFLRTPSWRVTGDVRDHAAVFRHLPLFLPADAVLVLEGGRHTRELRAFLDKHKLPTTARVIAGTIWPAQRSYHLPTTAAFLRDLADRTECCAGPEVCEHLQVYREDELLLQWFDAFSEPLYVSKSVPRDQLDWFCSALVTARVEEVPARCRPSRGADSS